MKADRRRVAKRNFECGDEAMLDAFFAKTLPPKQCAQVQTHVDGCEKCREVISDFELGASIAGLLREARDEVPNSLRRRLIETTTTSLKKGKS